MKGDKQKYKEPDISDMLCSQTYSSKTEEELKRVGDVAAQNNNIKCFFQYLLCKDLSC